MELNWDCYNAIMLYLEKNQTFETKDVRLNEYKIEGISPHKIYNDLSEYKQGEIYYALMKLDADGLIEVRLNGAKEIYEITDITTRGHIYLKQIKQQNKN